MRLFSEPASSAPDIRMRGSCQVIHSIPISAFLLGVKCAPLSFDIQRLKILLCKSSERKKIHLPFLDKVYEASLQLPFHLEGYLQEEISWFIKEI